MKNKPAFFGVLVACVGVVACGTAAPPAAGTSPAPSVSAQVKADLAPTGSLRVALTTSPPVIASKDPSTGELKGIGVDLGKELAARLGATFQPVTYPNIGAAMADPSGWDVVIGPINPGPADFTSPFLLIPHTYLVPSASSFSTAQDLDRTGVKIASVATSPHTAKLKAALTNAQVVPVTDDASGITLLTSGKVDAFASGGFALYDEAKRLTGYRVVSGAFFVAQSGIGVAHGHPAGLAYLSAFVSDARSSGLVQQAITRTGEQDLQVAPAA